MRTHADARYLDPAFLALLDSEKFEYRQVNLANVAKHAELFEHNGEAFDAVFDLTGEMGFDKPELVSGLE